MNRRIHQEFERDPIAPLQKESTHTWIMENETLTTKSPYQSTVTSLEEQLLTSFLALVIIFTILGNLLVVIVFFTYQPLQKVINIFLVSLALSDILVGAVNVPIWIIIILCDFDGIKVLGKVWVSMDITAGVASILNLAAVSVCRYIQITKPYTYKEILTKGRVMVCVAVIWTFSVLLATLKGLIPKNSDLWYYRPGYQALVFLVSFFLPLAGIFYCYFNMFKEVPRYRKRLSYSGPEQQNRFSVDVKAIKTIAIVVLMFVMCWGPFFVIVLVHGFCKCVTSIPLVTIVKILHYCNSAMNPLIYVWYNKQYRQAFISALRKFANQHDAEHVVTFLNNRAKGQNKRREEESPVQIVKRKHPPYLI